MKPKIAHIPTKGGQFKVTVEGIPIGFPLENGELTLIKQWLEWSLSQLLIVAASNVEPKKRKVRK